MILVPVATLGSWCVCVLDALSLRKVMVCCDGQDAVQEMTKGTVSGFGLVFMDLHMPLLSVTPHLTRHAR